MLGSHFHTVVINDGSPKVVATGKGWLWLLPSRFQPFNRVSDVLADTATVCGLPGALLVMVTVPTRLPATLGLKVTLRSQKPDAPKPAPQLFVTAKSPVVLMLVRLKTAPPVLVSLMVCTALVLPSAVAGKLIVVGLSATTGTANPVPLKLTVLGLLLASLVMTTLPLKGPTAVGAKVTLMLQLADGASVAPQEVILAKSPVAVMLLMFSTAPPVLLRVMAWAALEVPCFWLAKFLLVALRLSRAPWPMPVRAIVCGLPGASLVNVNVPVRVPPAVGLKLTSSVQKPPAPIPAPQLLVTLKSPVAAMLVMFIVAVPVLDRITVCAALVLAMFCLAKAWVAGRPLTTGTSLKVAVTNLAASMVTVQVAAVPLQAPLQAIRLFAGLAVRVTTSPVK